MRLSRLVALGALSLATCKNAGLAEGKIPEPPRAQKPLTVLFTGDGQGEIEPCG